MEAIPPETAWTASSMSLLASSAFSFFHPFPLASRQSSSHGFAFLCVSVVADRRRFGLFLLCTISSKLSVHLTQEWYLSARCEKEDTSLASEMSQQSAASFRKHLQTFPLFEGSPNDVSKQFLNIASVEGIASFSPVTLFLYYLSKMYVILICQVVRTPKR